MEKENFPRPCLVYRNQHPWIKGLVGTGGVLGMDKGALGMSGLGDSLVQFFALPETPGVPPYLIFPSAKVRRYFACSKKCWGKLMCQRL